MIDIKDLRKDKRSQSSIVVHALLDRLEAAESEALEQARLNGMGAEREAALLAKLEAAEKERDKLKELNIALCTKSNSQVIHNARLAEENDALRTENAALVEDMNLLRNNNMTLRAKIAAMERQKPVGKFAQHPSNGLWEQDGYGDNPEASPLYALPGAKGE